MYLHTKTRFVGGIHVKPLKAHANHIALEPAKKVRFFYPAYGNNNPSPNLATHTSPDSYRVSHLKLPIAFSKGVLRTAVHFIYALASFPFMVIAGFRLQKHLSLEA